MGTVAPISGKLSPADDKEVIPTGDASTPKKLDAGALFVLKSRGIYLTLYACKVVVKQVSVLVFTIEKQ